MSIMTREGRSSKSRPFTCSFVSINVEINGTRYAVDPIDPGECGTKAWRLTKHSGDHAVYDVIHDAHGCVSCSCPDYIARHEGAASMCKHGLSLVTLGLMPAPQAPVVTPAPAPHVPDEFDAPAPTVEVPAACCEPAEQEPCGACVTATPADFSPAGEIGPASAADAILGRGMALALAEAAAVTPADGDEGEFHDWTGESIAREHLDRSERLTLAELVDRQVEFYETWNNPAGDMLAHAMRELALKVRLTGATTPDEYEARIEVLDADIRDQYEAIGREQGRREALRDEMAGSVFGHMA